MPLDALPAQTVVWTPSPKQRLMLSCPVFELLFGGSRGGGKSDAILGEWAQHANQHRQHAIGLVVRRNAKQLVELFERAKVLYRPIGAQFVGSPEGGGMRVTMPGGARLTFAHLERDSDAENYQGFNLTRLFIEEAGNFPSPVPIMKLKATLRSGHGVPCRMRLTGNPGGPGSQWLRARYIDPAPLGNTIITDPETGLQRVYIPSRVHDNPYLGPEYVANLRSSGSPELVRAWLDGDWNVVAGAFFPEFEVARHVVAPRSLPAYWTRFRSFDWGSARPFCVQWWAVSDGELAEFPRGALICYREWYGSNGQPNVGLRLTAEEVGAGIAAREAGDVQRDKQMFGVADPAIFTADGGPSIGERMQRAGAAFRPADNTRVGRNGAMGGWDQLRARLKGDGTTPGMFVFSTCVDLIRTLPALQHDEARPEDLDSDGEDHAADAARYALQSRPYSAPLPVDVDANADRYARKPARRERSAWTA